MEEIDMFMFAHIRLGPYPRGRYYRHSSHVVHIPTANVYRFGEFNSARPVLRSADWTVRQGESWAVVGSGAGEKTALLEVGHLNRRPVTYRQCLSM